MILVKVRISFRKTKVKVYFCKNWTSRHLQLGHHGPAITIMWAIRWGLEVSAYGMVNRCRLDPLAARHGRVVREGTVSIMEIRSEGIPYRNGLIDVVMRVTVFSDLRAAKVKVFSLSDEPVQFVTGLNHRKGEQFIAGDDYYLNWASASGGVTDGAIEVGAAILFDADDFVQAMDDPSQALLISKPCKQLEYWICSANSNEAELNTMAAFKRFVADHHGESVN